MNFHKMSCTKLRTFLESKRAEWLSENISLSDLLLIKRRLYECSPKVYSKMKKFFNFMEHTIARKK